MRILIALVLYNSILEESQAFNSLCNNSILNQNNNIKFLIYDNSCHTNYPTLPHNLIAYYASDPQNGGISKAYNYAANYAKKKGFEWLLFADQDTVFDYHILMKYITSIKNNPDINLFLPKIRISYNGSYMSPVKKNHFICRLSDDVPSGMINPRNYGIINSGLLINVDAFLNVGGYNERVWLDYSDFQFIERFSQKYDKAFVIDGECIQSFSNDTPDIEQKINRFKLFCSSVKHFEPTKKSDLFWIFTSVVKRALSLSLQTRSNKPLIILFREYFK